MLWDDDPSINGAADAVSTMSSAIPVPGLGSLISIGSGLLGRNSARSANDQNRLNALYQMKFQSEEAQKAREWDALQNWSAIGWQERMSSTANQRAVGDLRLAGLNPILAATKGGASSPGASGGGAHGSPSGAMARAEPVYNAQLAQITAQAAQVAAQTELLKAETRKVNAEATNEELYRGRLLESQAGQATASAGHAVASTEQIRQEMTAFEDRLKKLKEEVGIAEYEKIIKSQEAYVGGNTMGAKVRLAQAEADRMVQLARKAGLEIPEAVAEAAYWNEVGKGGVYWREGSKAVGAAVGGTMGGLLGNALRRGVRK